MFFKDNKDIKFNNEELIIFKKNINKLFMWNSLNLKNN